MAVIDEYYAIRISRKDPRSGSELHEQHDIFITGDKRLGHLSKAMRFTELGEAEAYLDAHPLPDSYEPHIQFCTTENREQTDSEQSRVTEQLMEIPYPYRRTAYNWMRGKDVIGLLKGESDEVYERHHRFLLDYDIDISEPSAVIMLSSKKKQSRKSHHDSLPDNAPRQFFAQPGQRPARKSKSDEETNE
ncbi:MAG: hypothetical protein HUJ29_11965 [Gammaproteobacteria bacterium]|nr:hypothetical protein [Gammaproteobacteria bacterium]